MSDKRHESGLTVLNLNQLAYFCVFGLFFGENHVNLL